MEKNVLGLFRGIRISYFWERLLRISIEGVAGKWENDSHSIFSWDLVENFHDQKRKSN